MYTDLQAEGHGWIKKAGSKAIFNSEAGDGLMLFSPMVPAEDEQAGDDYPFTAILGSLRFHLGSGTRSSRSERILNFGLKGEVEISPEDGANLDLLDGDTVRIVSRQGVIQRGIRREDGVGKGQLFIPLAVNENDAMNLIGLWEPTTPEYSGLKTCPVRVEKL
jgi:anaerobic selenocysteine-containing dehydrogenase